MPVPLTYPGVYIEEVPSGARAISGVATSITAFIGMARRGPSNDPVRIQSFPEFERTFGGLWSRSLMSYAVQQYFQNGGAEALIVRVHNAGAAATLTLPTNFALVAASEGDWGEQLRARVDHDTRALEPGEGANSLFNLTFKDMQTGTVEKFTNVSTDPLHRRYVTTVLAQQSKLARILPPGTVPASRPDPHLAPPAGVDAFDDNTASTGFAVNGADGADIGDAQVSAAGLQGPKQGLWALEKADLYNLLCIPPYTREVDVAQATWDAAIAYSGIRRAMVIVDSPSTWDEPADVTDGAIGLDTVVTRDPNAAIFFPRIRVPDPLQENRLATFAPCGALAGVFARTDAQRGIWKAPAGIEATLSGVAELTVKLTDGENGILNPLGVNCLRAFPVIGRVVWGSRTLVGADQLASEWKYLPVRRLALFLEESLFRGTKWVVFEPNDEPLWAQIRLNIGAFMQNLFRQGAFQGRSPREAYFVKCDRETTIQADIDLGVVNIVVGFAPLKPAEFVVIKIQQMTGQSEA
jgi:phage tail sheath protein FI